MIFIDKPRDWKDLESKVCQILAECGCQTERSKHIVLPRGEVNIDVYALDTVREPNLIMVCECKHWRKRVSQTVVHAFRTLLVETGAHVGFLISSAGFQAGAVKAAKKTNVELVTWEAFQERFYDRWFKAMRIELAAVADEVFEYSDYFHRRTISVLHGIPTRVKELQGLWHRFSAYTNASSYNHLWNDQRSAFPIKIIDPRPRLKKMRTISIKDGRTYFDLMFASAKPAIDTYEAFISKYAQEDAE
jgi:Restriction endonuclease